MNFALQHNLGLGGAVVIAIYAKGFNNAAGAGGDLGKKSKFKSSKIFDKIEETLKGQDGEKFVAKVKGIFAFKVKVG